MPLTDHFLSIIPRHRQALELLREQRKRDYLGAIGVGAMREEDEPFTLEQIVAPLMDRGLVEDLTGTEMGPAGKYFVRITPLGLYCLGLGIMLRDPRATTEAEIRKFLSS